MKKLIILDRDGVINHDSEDYIKSPEEWHPIAGSLGAIAKLNRHFKVAIATNQSGIGRGYYDIDVLDAIHEKMQQALAAKGGHIDAIFYCPHKPNANCDCRKPKPGLIHQALSYFDVPVEQALVIGDSLRDLEAAQSANVDAILVATGNGAKTLNKHPDKLADIPYYDDLAEAALYLLN